MAFIDTYNLIIQNKYLLSTVIFVGFYLISQLVIFIIEKFVLRVTAKTATDIDDKLVRNSRKPITFLLITFGLKLAINPLSLPEAVQDNISKVLTAILILLLAKLIGSSSKKVNFFANSSIDKKFGQLKKSVLR